MTSWWWSTSVGINRVLCGTANEPLCSRAHRLGWARFDALMQIAFRDPCHCQDVHLRYVARFPLPENVNQRTDP